MAQDILCTVRENLRQKATRNISDREIKSFYHYGSFEMRRTGNAQNIRVNFPEK